MIKNVITRFICGVLIVAALATQQTVTGDRRTISPIEINLVQLRPAAARVTVLYRNVTLEQPRPRVYFLTVDYYVPGKGPRPVVRRFEKLGVLSAVTVEADIKLDPAEGAHLILATMTDITRPGAPVLVYLIHSFIPESTEF